MVPEKNHEYYSSFKVIENITGEAGNLIWAGMLELVRQTMSDN